MTPSAPAESPLSPSRSSPALRAGAVVLALLALGASACGEAEREARETTAEERPAATDTVPEALPADTPTEEATMEATEPADEAPESETGPDEPPADDVQEAEEETVPRMNPPEGRNWILATFRDSVTRDDLAWLADHGFHVDTVMGTTVRGWLEEEADRGALAEAEGGERIESWEALMRGPGR